MPEEVVAANRDAMADCSHPVESGESGPRPVARLAEIQCLINQGHRALGIVLAQQLSAEEPNNSEVIKLLDEQLVTSGKGTTAATSPNNSVLSGWAAAEVGHDSNINRATSEKAISIPLLNYRSLELPELLTERKSSFLGLQAAATASVPVTESMRASLNLHGSARANIAETAYLPHSYAVQGKVEQSWSRIKVGIGTFAVQQWVAKYRLLERRGVQLDGNTTLGSSFAAGIASGWASNVYPMFGNLKTKESSTELHAGYSPLSLQFSFFGGDERSTGAVKDLDRAFGGFNVAWRHQFGERVALSIDTSSGWSRYDQFSQLFATRRKDRQIDLTIAVRVRLSKDWSVTPKLVLERNDSSMALNTYRRTQYLAELRRDF